MPNCFQLTKKGESEPSLLSAIDDEMRLHFGYPPDPQNYLGNWVDVIGFRVAIGQELGSEELESSMAKDYGEPWPDETDFEKEERTLRMKMLRYLEKNYTSNAWAHR